MLKSIYSKYKEPDLKCNDLTTFKDYLNCIIPGSKVKWKNEKRRYTCIARSDHFIIVNKPYNLRKDYDGSPLVQYSILDLTQMKCNHDNLIFGLYDYSKLEDCEEALLALENSLLDESDRKSIKFESINVDTMEPYICEDKPTLEISQRGWLDIEDAIEGIWVEAEKRF